MTALFTKLLYTSALKELGEHVSENDELELAMLTTGSATEPAREKR